MTRTDLCRTYERDGFVRLPGAYPTDAAAAMADAVWAELDRKHDIVRHDRSSWTIAEPHGLGSLRKRGAFDDMATPACRAALNDLLGITEWPPPIDWGQALVPFPTTTAWAVPTTRWHIDAPARGAAGWTLHLKWLGYLEPVPPGGGGTLVIAGSHRLVTGHLASVDVDDRGHSNDLRRAVFASDPWFDLLVSDTDPDRLDRLLEQGTVVDDIEVRVVELIGEPGDLVFLHPHLFHAGAPNASASPRLMVTGGLIEVGA